MSFDALTLNCFIAVAETGSFTSAANKISRTQSAISQQIKKLENQIGKQLFERGKKIILTSEGEILLNYAKKIVQLNHEAINCFKQSELVGEVRFGLPDDFASVFLSDILTEYRSLYPKILLNIECDLTLKLFSKFKNKEFDLVLVKMNQPESLPNVIVWSEKLEWVGKTELFNLKNQPIPLVLSPSPCIYRSRAIKSLEKIQLKWKIFFSSHSYSGKMAAVKAGMGLTVLTHNMIPEDLKIIRSENNHCIPKLKSIYLSLLKQHNNNIAINLFEKFILKRLQ